MALETTEVVKKLQEMRDGGYLSDPILREAVLRVADADDRFDWVGIYLYNESEKELWLHNYVGEPTEHAKIPVGEGVCGSAVQDSENKIVNDVSAIDNYLACSPDVKSEMVVLIRAGTEILGQIDIDSDKKDAFEHEDEEAVQRVADKLAEVLAAERREA